VICIQAPNSKLIETFLKYNKITRILSHYYVTVGWFIKCVTCMSKKTI